MIYLKKKVSKYMIHELHFNQLLNQWDKKEADKKKPESADGSTQDQP